MLCLELDPTANPLLGRDSKGLTESASGKKEEILFFQKILFLPFFFLSEHPKVITHTPKQEKSTFVPKVLFSVSIFPIRTVGFVNSSSKAASPGPV